MSLNPVLVTLPDRLEGGIVGLLLGDALGVPFEFGRSNQIPPGSDPFLTARQTGFVRTHGKPEGTWSDDGAQALAMLDSLLTKNKVSVPDFEKRLVAWFSRGEYTPDGDVFDFGGTSGAAIRDMMFSGASVAMAWSRYNSFGETTNGCLMRALPMGLWHSGTDVALVADAETFCAVTHDEDVGRACVGFYTLWARVEAEGQGRHGYAEALARYRAAAPKQQVRTLAKYVLCGPAPQGGALVSDALRGAIYALAQAEDYAGVVREAINLGGDTDTTACIAGGLAGVRYGIAGIPPVWVAALRAPHVWRPLVQWLVERWQDAPAQPASAQNA